MTRRDWWLGVVAIVLALLAHAMLPRYEWQGAGMPLRVDRWTGRVTRYDGMTFPYAPLTIESYEPPPTTR